MKPFRYLIDTAYVVPALRQHTTWPKFNRRKIAIATGVLLIHGALVWALANMKAEKLIPIEQVETQVILEQIINDSSVPTPIPPSPQVQKRLQEKIASQTKPEQQIRHVNDNAVNTITTQSDTSKVIEPVAIPEPVVTATSKPADSSIAVKSTGSGSSQPKSSVSALKGGCGEVYPLKILSDNIDRNQKFSIQVKRGAGKQALSVSVDSTNSAALAADIQRKTMSNLRFVKKGPECDGFTGKLFVEVVGVDD